MIGWEMFVIGSSTCVIYTCRRKSWRNKEWSRRRPPASETQASSMAAGLQGWLLKGRKRVVCVPGCVRSYLLLMACVPGWWLC
jgi:hypothetical protein